MGHPAIMRIQRPTELSRHRWGCLTAGLALGLLYAAGCGRDTGDQTVSDGGLTRTASRGPVSVTLSAAPATLDFEQHAKLQLEVIAEKGVTVLDSEYERTLAEGDRRFEYRVVRSDKQLAKPTEDGRLRWAYEFEIEFFLPGNYQLPPAVVSFVDLSAGDDGRFDASAVSAPAEVQTVETKPLALVVRPPPRPELSEAELKNITRLDPVELPAVWSRWWWLVPVLIILVVIAVVLLARRLRRSHPEVAVQMPPHEWARQQIAALVAEDLLARGRVQEFHYRISGIVRGYIERRFDVCAPEMTTEEFLALAAGDNRFAGGMTEELNRFLSTWDLVKYARHEPGTEQSHTVLRAAGEFVERVAPF